MPDKWGRPTFDDGMKYASQGMGLLNQMNRNQMYSEQLGRLQEENENRRQIGLGLQALQNGQEIPENVAPINRVNAKGLYSQSLGYDSQAEALKRQKKEMEDYQNAFQQTWNSAQTGGTDSVIIRPGMSLSAVQGMNEAFSQYKKTKDGAVAAKESNNRFIAQNAAEFTPMARNALNFYSSGNKDQWQVWARESAKKLGLPYQLGKYEEGKGFQLLFRSDKTGDFSATGDYLSDDKAASMLNRTLSGDVAAFDVNGQKVPVNKNLAGFLLSARKATGRTNEKNIADSSTHKHFIDEKGKRLTLVPQSPLNDPESKPNYLVFSDEGLLETVTDLKQTAKTRGWKLENITREGQLQSLANAKQAGATSRAKEQLYEKQRKIAGAKKPIKISLGDQQTVYNKLASSLNPKLKVDLITGNAPSDPTMEKLTKAVLHEMQSGIPFLQARDMALDEIKRSGQPEPAKGHPANGRVSGPDTKSYNFGNRVDGTKKGLGYFGPLKTPDGKVATELSIGVDFDGREVEIPSIVPTLTRDEINHLISGGDVTDEIAKKAIDYAKQRMKQGKSPFAEDGEQGSLPSIREKQNKGLQTAKKHAPFLGGLSAL
ncbi:hypothetical protein [Maridesulfovibrio bastinii]|uniref:hypothetical protein n=1 Tax=Maridesulfovibrio bastinii TaxID=47157 RepID=UPI00041825BC|nr:hypothetical protein [Maridesulfovibrio bastinii]